jgi:hypothetical protein
MYIAKFERVLYEARGQDWPDVNKISAFRNGLASSIRSRLAQQLSLPRDYSKFVRVVQQLSGHSVALPSSSANHQPRPSYTPASSRPMHIVQRGEPMDLSEISAIDLYDMSPQHKATNTARSTTPPQRQQLRREGKCVRCGGSSHWVSDCPAKSYSTGQKITIAAINDDDAWSEGSHDSLELAMQEAEVAHKTLEGKLSQRGG